MPVKVLSRGLCLPDMAAGDNEIEQRRNFSETHFPEVAPCGFRLVGMMEVQCGIAVPMYVTRLGVLSRGSKENGGLCRCSLKI